MAALSDSLSPALRLLARFWLEEVRPADVATIAALPGLAETLPAAGAAALTGLAVEYQRLFGFNLPPYESVFVDPSGMLLAPATARVEALYRQAGWLPPPARVGAADHLGLELLALADWLAAGQTGPARQLYANHLAVWAPALALTLGRLSPPPFYAALGELTVELLLAGLPHHLAADPLPMPPPAGDEADDLAGLVRHLLTPCRAGLYLAREDIARLSRGLDLPLAVGDRPRMLETLFRQAGEYDQLPALLDRLRRLLHQAGAAYEAWATDYPAWTPYAAAWRARLLDSEKKLDIG